MAEPFRVFDLEGEDITNRVISLDLNAERGIATCVVRENGLRFHDGGRPWTIQVTVGRVTGDWKWKEMPWPKKRPEGFEGFWNGTWEGSR